MIETHISFYMKTYRIHIYRDMLTGIGSPKRICFMVADDGHSLLVLPYEKRDLRSHLVPAKAYRSGAHGGMEVNSMRLCKIISKLHGWEANASYRVPGKVLPEQKIAAFDLTRAIPIERLSLKEHEEVKE